MASRAERQKILGPLAADPRISEMVNLGRSCSSATLTEPRDSSQGEGASCSPVGGQKVFAIRLPERNVLCERLPARMPCFARAASLAAQARRSEPAVIPCGPGLPAVAGPENPGAVRLLSLRCRSRTASVSAHVLPCRAFKAVEVRRAASVCRFVVADAREVVTKPGRRLRPALRRGGDVSHECST